jgi:predicted histone-like DNA-binding protein
MRYKIVKETKPTLATYGKYKAKTVHNGEVSSREIMKEVARHLGTSEGTVLSVMLGLSTIINRHLRRGDKVRLEQWGMMKLEIESDKVDSPEQFKPSRHIRGVRLHFLPESEKGKPELYQDMKYEKMK